MGDSSGNRNKDSYSWTGLGEGYTTTPSFMNAGATYAGTTGRTSAYGNTGSSLGATGSQDRYPVTSNKPGYTTTLPTIGITQLLIHLVLLLNLLLEL